VQKAGLVKLGDVALDGTKIKADASKHTAMRRERMRKREAALKASQPRRRIPRCRIGRQTCSFRPLPAHRTCAPDPRWTASQSRPVSSGRRRHVGAATSSKVIAAAKPRRSIGRGEHRRDLGAPQEYLLLVVALARYGENAPGSAHWKDTNLKKDRMAVRRRLRVSFQRDRERPWRSW
jgi:hypothetical protein